MLAYIQRAFWALCLIAFFGCSAPYERKWECQTIDSNRKWNHTGRILLAPDNDYSHLELEIVKDAKKTRFYVNLLFLQACPNKEDPDFTTATIQMDGEEPYKAHFLLLKGGQKMIIPEDLASVLIDALLRGQDFSITIGRSSITASSATFLTAYEKLCENY